MRCPECGAQMVMSVDAELGQIWMCIDCPEEIEIWF